MNGIHLLDLLWTNEIIHLAHAYEILTHTGPFTHAIRGCASLLKTANAEHNKLKQIIGAKSAGNARAMRRIDRIEKEKSTMKCEVLKGKVAVQHIRSEYIEKEHERKSLCRSLSEKENQSVQMLQKLEIIQNEKDRIDAKLVKRNLEQSILQEKLDVMQACLDRGS